MFSLSQKKCSKCGEWKDKSEFYKNKSKPDGLTTECKPCTLINSRKWKSSNPDKVREYTRGYKDKQLESVKRWQKNNPEKVRATNRNWIMRNVEKLREYARKKYRENPARVLAHNKRWAAANPDKTREYKRKWSQAHPEKESEKWHKRRARIKGNGGVLTVNEWQSLKEFYNYTCLSCGKREPEIRLTRDHVIAIDDGGTNTVDNIQPLCKPCNSKKGTKYIDFRPIIFYG